MKEILKDTEFSKKYYEIILSLGFSFDDDLNAREILYEMLSNRADYSLEATIESVSSLISSRKEILIIGGGPDSSKFIQLIDKMTKFPHFNVDELLIIAIDGATELLAKHDIIPHLVFTDLDGLQRETALQSQYQETIFIVHAHGDNMDMLDRFRPLILDRNIVGTTQSPSKLPIINSGGFTDGDRALFFLQTFIQKYNTLFLVGFDFNSTIGAFSKPNLTEDTPASNLKRNKLQYGAQLTRDFCKKTESTVTFLESTFEFALKSDLVKSKNCIFHQFRNAEELGAIFPHNLLYLKKI